MKLFRRKSKVTIEPQEPVERRFNPTFDKYYFDYFMDRYSNYEYDGQRITEVHWQPQTLGNTPLLSCQLADGGTILLSVTIASSKCRNVDSLLLDHAILAVFDRDKELAVPQLELEIRDLTRWRYAGLSSSDRTTSNSQAAAEFRAMFGREPTTKTCAVCGERFREEKHVYLVLDKQKDYTTDVCFSCYRVGTCENYGDCFMSRQEILEYIIDVVNKIGIIPPSNHCRIEDLAGLPREEQIRLLGVLVRRPNRTLVKDVFGSWPMALIEAGVISEMARPTSRGHVCIALDGHTCRSMGERMIDDWLFLEGIDHQREKCYPGSSRRSDFYVKDYFIEYWGLSGDIDYDKKSIEKREFCAANGLKMVEINPDDLANLERLRRKLGVLLPQDSEGSSSS